MSFKQFRPKGQDSKEQNRDGGNGEEQGSKGQGGTRGGNFEGEDEDFLALFGGKYDVSLPGASVLAAINFLLAQLELGQIVLNRTLLTCIVFSAKPFRFLTRGLTRVKGTDTFVASGKEVNESLADFLPHLDSEAMNQIGEQKERNQGRVGRFTTVNISLTRRIAFIMIEFAPVLGLVKEWQKKYMGKPLSCPLPVVAPGDKTTAVFVENIQRFRLEWKTASEEERSAIKDLILTVKLVCHGGKQQPEVLGSGKARVAVSQLDQVVDVGEGAFEGVSGREESGDEYDDMPRLDFPVFEDEDKANMSKQMARILESDHCFMNYSKCREILVIVRQGRRFGGQEMYDAICDAHYPEPEECEDLCEREGEFEEILLDAERLALFDTLRGFLGRDCDWEGRDGTWAQDVSDWTNLEENI